MRILHARDYVVQPWKNGGGMTTEIAVSPVGAGFSDFEWRVSMAQVAADGPFSQFPGIDRSLALLDGAGLDLDVAGRGMIEVRPGGPPAVFPGDVAAASRLLAGPITDLNIMTRRGKWRHELSRVEISGIYRFEPRADVTVNLVGGPGGVAVGGRAVSSGDALLLRGVDEDGASELRCADHTVVWLGELWLVR
jgi:uncharacterized protein